MGAAFYVTMVIHIISLDPEWEIFGISTSNELSEFGSFLMNQFTSFKQFLWDQFLNGLEGTFMTSLSTLLNSLEIDNDVQVSPDLIDTVLPHLQELQNQLTNPEENASQLLAGVVNVKNQLSVLENEINALLFDSVSNASSQISSIVETQNISSVANDYIDAVLGQFRSVAINSIGQFSIFILERLAHFSDVLDRVINTMSFETEMGDLSEFFTECSPFLGLDLLVILKDVIPATVSFIQDILENISIYPDVGSFIHQLFSSITSSEFGNLIEELIERPFFNPLTSFIDAITPFFEDVKDQLVDLALNAGQTVLSKLYEISAVIG